MSSKDIHIVFQVLNFISSPQAHLHKLTPDEKLFLIFLAKHKGIKGIYPGIDTLAKELDRHPRNIQRTLARLEKKNLVYVDRSFGRKNHYFLVFPEAYLSTTNGVDATPGVDATHGVHAVQPTASTPHTHGAHAVRINKINNTDTKSERARKKPRRPLSDQFEPTSETIKSAKSLGLSSEELNEEFDKFMDYYLADGCKKSDWQLMLLNWFERAIEYKNKNPQRNEIRSTVKDFEPDTRYERSSDNGTAARALGQIMEKLKLNGKGGLNGQGLHGRVEKEKGSETQ